MSEFSFPKSERICNKHDIDLLFGKAYSVRSGNLALRFIIRGSVQNEPLQKILIVVPKKRVGKAVDRNKIKRRLREIYRLNRQKITIGDKNEKTLLMAIIYAGGVESDYIELEKNYLKAHQKMMKEMAGVAG